MEYLAPEHQDLAVKGLEDLHGKLPSPPENVLEDLNMKTEYFSFACVFRTAQDYTNRLLPTAALIWEYLLMKTENKLQKFAVMDKLFHVQVATGPWNVALETAKNLFNETTEYSSNSADQKEAIEDLSLTEQLLFNACMNLGSVHRLLKDLHTAEDLYKKAMGIAEAMEDFDGEALAKTHLAICLLDRGELKEAIETYFKPLMVYKSKMSNSTRALFLQYYGNACRSAADWGPAKEYLREALYLAKEVKDAGLVSSCCGDLGNVFRSEGRFKDAERLHTTHYNIALSRGDIHGLAIACGNIGFLKFYNPEEFDDSVVYQFIEYSLAEQVGDFARMGIAFNKIGKLYTTLGYYDEAVDLFEIALDAARKADNVAGEGMAWGNLGNVYRALERFEDAIACHLKYRDNAERRLDIGGLAIMQHQLAMDYFLCGKLPEAEKSILSAFQTLEKIRAQIGEDEKSKLSNFEKNQAEAYNLLQVVLVAQRKYKEAFVLADASRGRALSEIVRKRLCGSTSSGTETNCLNEKCITESFESLLQVSRKLSSTLILYSVVKEFDETGAVFTWVYAWVLHSTGTLHFSKTRLQSGIKTKVELNDEFVVSLRRSMALKSDSEALSEVLKCEKLLSVPREGRVQPATVESEDVLKSLSDLEIMFAGWKCGNDKNDRLQPCCGALFKDKEVNFPDLEIGVESNESLNGEPREYAHHSNISQIKSLQIAKQCSVQVADKSEEQESYQDTGAALCREYLCLTTEEKLLQNHPVTKSDIESEKISTAQQNNSRLDLTDNPDNYLVKKTFTDCASAYKDTCKVVASTETLNSQEVLKEDNRIPDLSKQNKIAGQDQTSPVYSAELKSVAPMQATIVSVDFMVRNPEKDDTEDVELIPIESIHVQVAEWKGTSQASVIEESNGTYSTQLYTGVQENGNSNNALPSLGNHVAMVDDPSGKHPKQTTSSEAFTTSGQSANDTELQYILGPTATNDDVFGDSHPCSVCDVVSEPIDTKTEETGSSEVSVTLMQSVEHTEIEKNIQDPLLSINDFSKNIISGPTNNVTSDHTYTYSIEIANDKSFTTQNAYCTEDEGDELDHLAPSNEVHDSIATDITSALTETHSTGEQSIDFRDDPVLAPWRPMLSQLHKVLIEPIQNSLPRKDENPRITFIPQDFLLKVPFAALQGDTNHRYFMEDYIISTSPSIQFLGLDCEYGKSSEQKTSLELSLLAVGNPKMPFDELPQLPSAQREVRMISEIINSENSEVFIGAQARKKDVLAAIPRHKILHFATHAVIDDSDSHGDFSMKGLIVLAKSESNCNGLLTAEEVRGMELNAELVVLSCCDTGLGKVTGDGVLGLSRAFLAAGAACVIVTLWKIDDRSASELMTSFYREYKTSRDAAVSLQKAMKILQAKEDTRSPRHWAAFSIVGTTGVNVKVMS